MRDARAWADKKAVGGGSRGICRVFYGTVARKKKSPGQGGRGTRDLRDKDPVAPPRWITGLTQELQDVVRLSVGLGKNRRGCLRQNLVAGQVRRFGCKVGIHDGRLRGRHVLIGHAQAAHRRTDGEGLESA